MLKPFMQYKDFHIVIEKQISVLLSILFFNNDLFHELWI